MAAIFPLPSTATEAAGWIVEHVAPAGRLLDHRAGGERRGVDRVVVAHRQREVVLLRVELGRNPSDRELEVEAVLAGSAAAQVAEKQAILTDLPWPYRKVDPLAAAEIAYAGYYKGACCYGVFEGIVAQLRKEIGAPYTTG
jgi:hypothetical protein